MNILVITNTPWATEYGLGNTLDNIFGGIDGLSFANIYCRYGTPNNSVTCQYYQITERSLLKNLINKAVPSGKRIEVDSKVSPNADNDAFIGFNKARKMRLQLFFWGRDLIWKIGRWKSPDLDRFIEEFKPDLIFQPIYPFGYINDINLYIQHKYNIPEIGYYVDDNVSLRQFNLSPLYWIDRLIKRKKVIKVIKCCTLLYVISDIQKQEVEKDFQIESKLLTKSSYFNSCPPTWKTPDGTVSLLYAGNIGDGRWKTLAIIARAINQLRNDGYDIKLSIYTATPLSNDIKKSLQVDGCQLNGPITSKEVQIKQQEADVMVHVEGLSLKSRLAVHQSFSTKLVDFFSMGKCIFAMGTLDEASILHLHENDAAIIAFDEKGALEQLRRICENPQVINEYGKKAYHCGAQFHNKEKMNQMIIDDFSRICKKNDNISSQHGV